MVPRSCGKDGCKPRTRQSLGAQLREGHGKEHPSATDSPSHSQTAKAPRYKVVSKHS